MKKTEEEHKTYRHLSVHESALLNTVQSFPLFSYATIKRRTKWNYSTIRNTVQTLKQKGVITAVKKGAYAITEQIPEHLFSIAVSATNPSYISFWTAASFYGFTEQQVQTIQIVSPKQQPIIQIGKHRVEVTTFQPRRFYGYKMIKNFAIAEKEKLIVDMLYKPEKAGGIREVTKILRNMWKSIDQKILLSSMKQFQNKSLFARLGYLLEIAEIKHSLGKQLVRQLPQTYVLLNAQIAPTKKYNKKWRVIVNDQ
jgi:predicted transcriptional regulator of viral defense system